MPRFAFDARTVSGESVHGFEIAADEHELDRRLADDDLLLVRARPIRARGRSKANYRTLVDLCYHLAVVVEAGIPILAGLRDLTAAGHPMAEELDGIARNVERGSSLSGAMDEYPEHFPHLVRALVRAGEESGSLDRVLHDLVRYLEWREELRREIRSALTYPSIVIVAMGGLVALLTLWVLPTFMEIFIELRVDLPITTRTDRGAGIRRVMGPPPARARRRRGDRHHDRIPLRGPPRSHGSLAAGRSFTGQLGSHARDVAPVSQHGASARHGSPDLEGARPERADRPEPTRARADR